MIREVIEEHKDKDVIIMHCFKSQVRGPTCARILKDNMERYLLENPLEKHPEM
jgi:hypothetical protein